MAAPMRDVNRTLKDALYETLTSILSPIHDVRIGAEQQISALEVTDGKSDFFMSLVAYALCK